MKAGRRPTSDNVLNLRGSWRGKARAKQVSAREESILPEAPEWISSEAKKHWNVFGNELAKVGIISPLTLELLTRYAVALARWEKAITWIEAHDGGICETEKGYVYAHPYVKLSKELSAELLRIEQELGMTPGSARSLGLSQKDGVNSNTATGKERFFKR